MQYNNQGIEQCGNKVARRLRVHVLQPSSAPYRVGLFKQLSRIFSISVSYVAGGNYSDRIWDAGGDDGIFQTFAPKYFAVSALGKRFTFSMAAALSASRNADVIVTCTNVLELPTYLLASLIARWRGVAVLCLVTVGQDYAFLRRPGVLASLVNFVARAGTNVLIRLSHSTIGYSRSGVRRAEACGRGGVSSSQYYPLEEEYGPTPDPAEQPPPAKPSRPLRACIIGYISPRKGLTEFFELIRRQALEDEVLIKIAAPLPETDAYVQDLLANHPSNVSFIGPVKADKKADLFRESDVLIFPTLLDSWGYVVNEAMYWGVPVIATSYSEAAKDLVRDGINGWTFQNGASFVNALSQAATPDIWRRASANAWRDVRVFNEATLSAWAAAIETAASHKRD